MMLTAQVADDRLHTDNEYFIMRVLMTTELEHNVRPRPRALSTGSAMYR